MAFPDLLALIGALPTATIATLLLIPAAILGGFCLWNRRNINLLGIWLSFGLGALAVYPVGLFQLLTLPLIQIFEAELQFSALRAFIHTAFSEEGAKLVIILTAIAVAARRPADAVGSGLAVGLGFAAAENLIYAATAAELQSLSFTRVMTALPAHAVFGLIMGSLVALAMIRPQNRPAYGTAALFIPSLLHGMYNFPLYMLAGIGAATTAQMWTYGSLFVLTVFMGVTVALTTADNAMRPAPIAAGQKI